MPITFAELTSNHASLIFDYNGHDIAVEYAPELVTEKTLKELMTVAKQGPTVAQMPDASGTDTTLAELDSKSSEVIGLAERLNGLLARLVYTWDLQENDGVTMYPLTPERLADLPLDFRMRCAQAVFGALRMGEPNGIASQPTSHASSAQKAATSSRKRG